MEIKKLMAMVLMLSLFGCNFGNGDAVTEKNSKQWKQTTKGSNEEDVDNSTVIKEKDSSEDSYSKEDSVDNSSNDGKDKNEENKKKNREYHNMFGM